MSRKPRTPRSTDVDDWEDWHDELVQDVQARRSFYDTPPPTASTQAARDAKKQTWTSGPKANEIRKKIGSIGGRRQHRT